MFRTALQRVAAATTSTPRLAVRFRSSQAGWGATAKDKEEGMEQVVFTGHTEYAGRRTVTLIPGDGIGPELADSVRTVFKVLQPPVDFEEVNLSGGVDNVESEIQHAVNSIKRTGVALKGIVDTPRGLGSRTSLNMRLRLELDLFANVVLCKHYPGVDARIPGVDIAIVRQNTEGEYSGLEHEIAPGIVESLKVISREESLRIAKFAFDYAYRRRRSKVTAVHKANIMKQGDGLFLECCKEVSELYPSIEFEPMIVDNTSMQLVSKPHQFDVMVTPNLYGNIVGNIGAGLVGGPGFIPGFNIGEKHVIFEPGARHSARDIAGKGVANPIAMLTSSGLMLKHLGFHGHASLLQNALESCMADGHTPGAGAVNTAEITEYVCKHIESAKDSK